MSEERVFDLVENPEISTVTLNDVQYDIELPQHLADRLLAQVVDPDIDRIEHFRIKRKDSQGYKSIIKATNQCDTEANLRSRLQRLAAEKGSLKFPAHSHCKLSDDTTFNEEEKPKTWSDVLNNDYSLVICCMNQKTSPLKYELNDENILSLMKELGAPYPLSNSSSSSDQSINLAYAYKSDDVVTVGSYVTNGHNDSEYARRIWELLGGKSSQS